MPFLLHTWALYMGSSAYSEDVLRESGSFSGWNYVGEEDSYCLNIFPLLGSSDESNLISEFNIAWYDSLGSLSSSNGRYEGNCACSEFFLVRVNLCRLFPFPWIYSNTYSSLLNSLKSIGFSTILFGISDGGSIKSNWASKSLGFDKSKPYLIYYPCSSHFWYIAYYPI